MAAYMIVFARIKDRARFLEEYAKPAAELVQRFGGRYVVRAPGAKCLEGHFGEGDSIVVSEWPDVESIRRFWEAPEYERLKEARLPLADVDVIVVEQPP